MFEPLSPEKIRELCSKKAMFPEDWCQEQANKDRRQMIEFLEGKKIKSARDEKGWLILHYLVPVKEIVELKEELV